MFTATTTHYSDSEFFMLKAAATPSHKIQIFFSSIILMKKVQASYLSEELKWIYILY